MGPFLLKKAGSASEEQNIPSGSYFLITTDEDGGTVEFEHQLLNGAPWIPLTNTAGTLQHTQPDMTLVHLPKGRIRVGSGAQADAVVYLAPFVQFAPHQMPITPQLKPAA